MLSTPIIKWTKSIFYYIYILILYKVIRHERFSLFTLIPLKNIWVKENSLVDAKWGKPIFYFFKVLHFLTKNAIKTCKEI